MTDIVWLLRNDVPCNGDIDCAGELCNQAAEEIERLRKDLSLAVFADKEYWQVLEKENERLRAALERIAFGKYHWEADAQEEAPAALEGKND